MSVTIKPDTATDTGRILVWKDQQFMKVLALITPAGSYATGGDTLDLTALFSLILGTVIPTQALPAKIEIQSNLAAGGTGSTGMFVYRFLRGTTMANGTFQVLTGAAAQSALTELSAGAYPANVLADVIQAEIWFPLP